MFEKKRIYILVKTYPTISKEYSELVCTAGVLEDGSWIRIYPVPFRKLEDDQKYPKYSWIQAEVERNRSDFRPESYRPNLDSIQVELRQEKIDWEERRRIVFKNKQVYTNLLELIEKSRHGGISLAVFKPMRLLNFVAKEEERNWDEKKLESLRAQARQLHLFKSEKEVEEEFRLVKKIPYRFYYQFEDDSGIQSTMMIADWEIGMLYLNCLKSANGDEKIAIEKVRQKYFDDFLNKDLHLFLGTTRKHHNVAPNPFMIIGVFYPPMPSSEQQLNLFD